VSDVVIRWLSEPGEEVREKRFENVTMDLLMVGPHLVGWRIKSPRATTIIPMARLEMVTEYPEVDRRDDPEVKGRIVGAIPKAVQ